MPWTETDVVDQRTEFVLRVLRGVEDFGAVCREYGISRKTGYKWKERFFTEGLSGLRDHSRRPVRSPSEIGEAMTCAIINLKLAHRGWGPRKIRAVLGRSLGTREIPSESSFKRILERVGLVQHRVRRSRAEQGGAEHYVDGNGSGAHRMGCRWRTASAASSRMVSRPP